MNYSKWVDDKIYWLTAMLSVTNDIFQKNYNSIPELYRHFESGKTQDAQKAVDIISKNFGIVPPALHYDWSGELDHNLNIKGQMSKGQITISLTFTLSKYALAATVAHELMHYILIYRKNITLTDNTENEKVTDLAAIVLGLGNIMLNGKFIGAEGNKISTLGYLTFEEIAYAYKKIDNLRSVSNYSNLTYDAKRILDGIIEHANSATGFNFRSSKHPSQAPYKTMSLYESIIFGFKKTYYWLNVVSKKILTFVKNLLASLYGFTQRKKCPFCHYSISRVSRKCGHCNRTLMEPVR